jgi:adenylosuccinate synthase
VRRLSAVIGASYGDEGKGHVTDYLAEPGDLVVRFNGGAQAGHTVTTPGGRRHVFHHIGSGTLRSAPTFLSRFFVCNPIAFVREMRELPATAVFVDPDAPVTTPYDMMLNQAAEIARGVARHGSCGLGINETIERQGSVYWFVYSDLILRHRDALRERVRRVRDEWVPLRAAALGLPLESMPYLLSEEVLERYLDDLQWMLTVATTRHWADAVNGRRGVVFEGAQGLALDQDAPGFPHVTRSKTGLTNVMTMLAEAGITDPLQAVYVTRPYLTRHGAGPLEHETPGCPAQRFRDETNVTNRFQGVLRFAELDLGDLRGRIRADRRHGRTVTPVVAVTCADQVEHGGVGVWEGGRRRMMEPWHIGERLSELIEGDGLFLLSAGETRNHVLASSPLVGLGWRTG